MRRYIIVVASLLAVLLFGYTAFYQMGFYVDIQPNKEVTSCVKTDETTIYLKQDGAFSPFEVRGVDMGGGIPGKWATDYAISYETYLRWFAQIQDLGANTIRVYTILQDDFYNAFYDYNKACEEKGTEPLYLLHGVWVNDYIANSHRDGFDDEFRLQFIKDSKTLVDILHGKRSLSLGYGVGSGSYRKDVSDWVLGYILGVEWESSLVTYTNQKNEGKSRYQGAYLYTTENASPFESLLCEVGDSLIDYESKRYKTQKLLAFSNWPTTDPFCYDVAVTDYREKTETFDVEQIKQTDRFLAGQFASYHIYPYYPDYLESLDQSSQYSQQEEEASLGKIKYQVTKNHIAAMNAPFIGNYLTKKDYYDQNGDYNTYRAYLTAISRYHTMPVVISEFGVTTGRGVAKIDKNTNRNQGHMTEQEQGAALVQCYEDIIGAGCAGGCVFSWQDEWFKRTWNTMHLVNLDNTAYWSDYQTNEQFFGLLTFDPGKESSVCYVDGDPSEWTDADEVLSENGYAVSCKYDEKFLYFMVEKDRLSENKIPLYLPIDTTPKSGSKRSADPALSFTNDCDFLLVLDGKENSELLVQERYDPVRATYGDIYYGINPHISPPKKDSSVFTKIYLPLSMRNQTLSDSSDLERKEKHETGKLRYGNANPTDANFDSLSDFMIKGDVVEIRLPWSLMNFSNPSEMKIHDDYYEVYGVEELKISQFSVGVGPAGSGEIQMADVPLKPWGKTVTSHERLKESYFIFKDYWNTH